MTAIINVINNPSFIKRGLQSLHETEIFTFLFFFFLKRKQKFATRTKMIALLPVGEIVYFFRSPCLYWDDTGESVNTKAKGSVAQTFQVASLIFMFHRHFTPFLCPAF